MTTKIVTTCVLAFLGLAFANDYVVKVKNDGSTIQGGTVRFVAEVFDDGVPAAGPFRYEWIDNTIAQHEATHDSNSNKDEWVVSYTDSDQSSPGSYITTLTVKKLMNFAYVPVAKKQSSLSVTRHLHGAFLVSTKLIDNDYMVTHQVVLTTPNTKYLDDNGASVSTYWYVDGVYYGTTNGLTFTMKYPKLYRRIAVQALVVAQLHGNKKSDNSQTIHTYIDNLMDHPVINHYATCNASFPYSTTTTNNIEANKNTVLGCFTRTFRLWDSLVPENLLWYQPFITSGSLDDINYAREKMFNSQNWELEQITDPFVKTILSDRIDTINRKVPILAQPNPFDYSTLNARMERLHESEQIALDRNADPFVKSLIQQRMTEKNKKIPHLAKSNVDDKFSNSLDAIHQRLNDVHKSQDIALQYVTDPVAKAALTNRFNEENQRLSIKSKEVDTRLKESLSKIHNRMSELKKSQQEINADDKVPSFLKSNNVIQTKTNEVNKRIEDLKNAENVALDRIDDPTIKSIVLDRIHEQNKKIPILLKSSAPETAISGVLDAIHGRIDDEIQRSSDIALDGIKDPLIKETVKNKIDVRNQMLKEKSKQIDKNLEIPLSEIRNKIKALKDAEDLAVENISDPDTKEDVISAIDKENEKIPVLMLPMIMGKNASFVLDIIRAKLEGLTNNEAAITRNVTDPIIQAMVASKLDKVNYILNTKFKLLSDSFSNVLNAITASVDESSTEEKKTPVLTKTLEPETEDFEFPASLASNFSVALDAINDRINNLKNSTNVVTQNITIPAIQALVASKLDKVNSILSTKYKELSNNFTNIIDIITAKLANVTIDTSKKSSKLFNKVPKLGISLDSDSEAVSDPTELITNFTVALDALRTKMDDLQNTQDVITQNITNPFAQSIVASKLNIINFMLNAKYKQLSDNFTSFLNTISDKKTPKLGLSLDSDIQDLSMPASLATNFSIALDAINARLNDIKNTADIITQNITDPAVQAIVASKFDNVSTILSTKYQELSDNFTSIINTITAKLGNVTFDTSKKNSKKFNKVPKLGISLDSNSEAVPDPTELITNFTVALDTLRTKMDDLQNAQDVITQNITNPFAQSIVASKLNMINFMLNAKYKQLSDNFTNFLNTISDKKTPKLGLSLDSDIQDLSMPASLATNFSIALDAISTRLDDIKNTTDVITQNITDPAVQAMVASKLDKVSTILSTKYQELSDNFTSIIDTINEKLANATADISKKGPKKPKKVPKLGKTLDGVDSEYLSDPSEIITNFTIALDAIRTRIDDLKNSENVITQNITNPFAQAIVGVKLDRINFILKTKYKQLNDNFTNIMDTINARLANASDVSVADLTGARQVPKLTKADFGPSFTTIMDTVRTKITGKLKPVNATVKYIKDPAIREVVMNKIIEENKNLSTIADSVEANLTAALDEFTKKAKDLNTLEDLTVDYIEDPNVQAAVIKQIEEENEEIPMLALSKRDSVAESEKPVKYTPPKSMFRMKYPTVIRF